MNQNVELPNMVNNNITNQNPVEPKFFQQPVAPAQEPTIVEPAIPVETVSVAPTFVEPVIMTQSPLPAAPNVETFNSNPVVEENLMTQSVNAEIISDVQNNMPNTNFGYNQPVMPAPEVMQNAPVMDAPIMNQNPTVTPVVNETVAPAPNQFVGAAPMMNTAEPQNQIPKFCPNCGNGKENKNYCSNCGCKLI